ncbi:hypothetical protein ACSLBF_07350 [Pseudoalteromonas sp. T1lg65]|uniref:hypothetical protein n=1 Tax=Pseudoalteromonas sp. T1lg65 TaxID=2077101 RepID=UPI003F7974C2
MRENTVLIITIGRTDLKKAIIDEQGKFIELPDTFSRHYLSGEGNEKAQYAPKTVTLEHALELQKAAQEAAVLARKKRDPAALCEPNGASNKQSAQLQSEYADKVIPVKLIALLQELKHPDYKGPKPNTIIILNTDRNELDEEDRDRKREPYAYGPIIAQWFADELKLPYKGIIDATISLGEGSYVLNYINGKMNFYGSGKDDPVNRKALENICCVIQRLVDTKPNTPLSILYSPGGGAGNYKPQIEALCDLYADHLMTWTEPEKRGERTGKGSAFEQASRYPSPDTSFRARKQIIGLLKKGNLQGAAAIAEAFTPESGNRNQCDHAWARAIQAANFWLQGQYTIEQLNEALACPLPLKDERSLPNSLWCAFRLEAALKMGNYQDAIRLTCDISEIMLQDYFANCLSEVNYDFANEAYADLVIKLGDKPQLIDLFSTAYNGIATTKNGQLQKPFSDTLAHLSNKKVSTVKTYLFENQDEQRRIAALDIICSLHIATTSGKPLAYQPNHLLKNYESTLRGNGDPTDLSNPKAIRNTITHGYLSQSKLQAAIQSFVNADLWHKSDTGEYSFLAHKTFADLYSQLDVKVKDSPYRLFTQLIGGLITQLKHAPVDFEEHA